MRISEVFFTQYLILLILVIPFVQNGPQIPAKKYHIPSIRANWFKAYEFCNSIGMQLVTIRSREENDAVGSFIEGTDKFNPIASFLWIGGSDLAEEGVFSWMATAQLLTFTNFYSGEPSNANGGEDCLHLVYLPSMELRWKWNDNNCKNNSLHFVCENTSLDCVTFF
ncbi:C-type lectin 37Da-like [Toxorhynchites rutilus septentrionalis]|uniref:C-type lectin 37Da-like n=1 Tax=Toxorhynchites rutilus septentrionalis TaxID=329112 RepID=UPI00247A197F|nr:C-type lectin 37Da-like [Toxorhynchites rutilus septentrionalis]